MCVYVLTLYMCHECMHVCVEVYICAIHMCKHICSFVVFSVGRVKECGYVKIYHTHNARIYVRSGIIYSCVYVSLFTYSITTTLKK